MADKKNSPAEQYPELVKYLVEVSTTVKKLHTLTSLDAVGKQLGLTKQGIHHHAKKEQEA